MLQSPEWCECKNQPDILLFTFHTDSQLGEGEDSTQVAEKTDSLKSVNQESGESDVVKGENSCVIAETSLLVTLSLVVYFLLIFSAHNLTTIVVCLFRTSGKCGKTHTEYCCRRRQF